MDWSVVCESVQMTLTSPPLTSSMPSKLQPLNWSACQSNIFFYSFNPLGFLCCSSSVLFRCLRIPSLKACLTTGVLQQALTAFWSQVFASAATIRGLERGPIRLNISFFEQKIEPEIPSKMWLLISVVLSHPASTPCIADSAGPHQSNVQNT